MKDMSWAAEALRPFGLDPEVTTYLLECLEDTALDDFISVRRRTQDRERARERERGLW
jgi:hypothetical protein